MSIASTANEHSEEFRPALRQLPTKAGTGIKILNCGGYISVVGPALAGPAGGVACCTARLAVAGPAVAPGAPPSFEPHRWSIDAALGSRRGITRRFVFRLLRLWYRGCG